MNWLFSLLFTLDGAECRIKKKKKYRKGKCTGAQMVIRTMWDRTASSQIFFRPKFQILVNKILVSLYKWTTHSWHKLYYFHMENPFPFNITQTLFFRPKQHFELIQTSFWCHFVNVKRFCIVSTLLLCPFHCHTHTFFFFVFVLNILNFLEISNCKYLHINISVRSKN